MWATISSSDKRYWKYIDRKKGSIINMHGQNVGFGNLIPGKCDGEHKMIGDYDKRSRLS